MDFVQRVDKTIEKYSMLTVGDTVVIGLSGGADSVALLCSLCAIKEKYDLKLHAAHVNHMIRGNEAKRDEQYSKSLAEKLGVEFHLLECDIPALASKLGISEEMAGRNVRYEFFGSIAGENAKIAVAHHKGDSAETTLINMIRGSALNGLKGISPVNGNIIRPLIECDKDMIVKFLESQGIEYMTDSTNAMDIYVRNAVRNKIIHELLSDDLISQSFCSFIFIVDYFHAVFSQDFRKTVVFLLRNFKIRDIIEQQSFEIARYQTFDFIAQSVEQYFIQFTYF